MAVILIAERYAVSASSVKSGAFKSEKFDDYSYTLGDGGISFDDLSINALLDEFICSKGNTLLRLRKL
jgi:hypothetical protein